MTKILILCTGNSCRSQMAEGFLKSFDKSLIVYSAGTAPAFEVHPLAIEVMKEVNIDISKNLPKSVNEFLNSSFDYVITVCGGAKESCPAFIGNVKSRLHIGFDDPAEVKGTQDEIIGEFRRIRDEIKTGFYNFYLKNLI
ncbi:MAG: arsenate reductase ArsC [Lutibacter sp.]|uniref:arsenate reductase ArsC n=1 Tax=Lutibacter sp. TaxID=1925666 RepID=UPI00299E73AF|nr:arsenate reductase ArsC [Lutibacter sp.]MDX1828488.1 arsenate reductase ArsC [Lutibacter sp.]